MNLRRTHPVGAWVRNPVDDGTLWVITGHTDDRALVLREHGSDRTCQALPSGVVTATPGDLAYMRAVWPIGTRVCARRDVVTGWEPRPGNWYGVLKTSGGWVATADAGRGVLPD